MLIQTWGDYLIFTSGLVLVTHTNLREFENRHWKYCFDTLANLYIFIERGNGNWNWWIYAMTSHSLDLVLFCKWRDGFKWWCFLIKCGNWLSHKFWLFASAIENKQGRSPFDFSLIRWREDLNVDISLPLCKVIGSFLVLYFLHVHTFSICEANGTSDITH